MEISGGPNSKLKQRLLNELKLLQKDDTIKWGYSCLPDNPSLTKWSAKIYNTFHEHPLGDDMDLYMQKYHVDYLLLELTVDDTYPLKPPKVRLIQPRFKPFSGNVNTGGIVHSELLTERGWTPVNTISTVLQDLKTQFILGDARLELECNSAYELEEAMSSEGFYHTYLCHSPVFISKDDEIAGGKIMLPPSALSKIVSLPLVNFPLVFELTNTVRSTITHTGVIEFNAPEGQAIVPSWVMNSLGLNEGSYVNIRMVNLPKGEFVRLQPLEEEFATLSDSKAILESALRSFAALTVGDQIHIVYEDKIYTFLVLEAKPSPAIGINNTDIEVDLFYMTAAPATADRVPGRPGDDAGDRDPAGVEEETVMVPVVETGHVLRDARSDVVTSQCSNCLKDVPSTSIERHEAFCKRNNIRCLSCTQVLPKTQLTQHQLEMHILVKCVCGEGVEQYQLVSHKNTSCLHRPKKCKYCHLSFKMLDMKDHRAYCGSRTEVCNKCKRPVMLRDFRKHMTSNCAYPIPTHTQRPTEEKNLVGSILGFLGW